MIQALGTMFPSRSRIGQNRMLWVLLLVFGASFRWSSLNRFSPLAPSEMPKAPVGLKLTEVLFGCGPTFWFSPPSSFGPMGPSGFSSQLLPQPLKPYRTVPTPVDPRSYQRVLPVAPIVLEL